MAYEYRIGKAVALTGTVTISAGAATVAGSGTAFQTQVAVDDLVIIAGQTRVVQSITSDVLMTMTANWTEAASGVSGQFVSFDLLFSLGLSAPKGRPSFRPYSKLLDLGNGQSRGAGWITTEWRWGWLTQTQRDLLKTYCATRSASVYIRTRKPDNSYANYSAVLLWPEVEDVENSVFLDFVLQFRAMVAV